MNEHDLILIRDDRAGHLAVAGTAEGEDAARAQAKRLAKEQPTCRFIVARPWLVAEMPTAPPAERFRGEGI